MFNSCLYYFDFCYFNEVYNKLEFFLKSKIDNFGIELVVKNVKDRKNISFFEVIFIIREVNLYL